MDVLRKLWARKMSGPRSTREMKTAEFEGGISRLGRGGVPLSAWALRRPTAVPMPAGAKGELANLCMAGDVHGIFMVQLGGSKGCLGRPLARKGERRP